MKPTKNMFATQEEWIQALAAWMDEDPTLENQKTFMVFEGGEPTAENFMFEGDLLDFADMYFAAQTWSEVVSFAQENGYSIFIEDSERWEELGIMVDDAAMAEEETFYDSLGNESPGGIYDAGGHLNAERMAEWADVLRDQRKYGD